MKVLVIIYSLVLSTSVFAGEPLDKFGPATKEFYKEITEQLKKEKCLNGRKLFSQEYTPQIMMAKANVGFDQAVALINDTKEAPCTDLFDKPKTEEKKSPKKSA